MGEPEFIQWSIVQRSFHELMEYGTEGFESSQELSPLYLYFLWGIRKISEMTAINLPHIGCLYLSILRGISDCCLVGSFALLTKSYSLAILLGLLVTLSPEYAAYGGALGNVGLSLTMIQISTAFFLLVIRYRKNWLAVFAIFFSWMAVQIHSSCFFSAVSLILLLLLMDFKNLTYPRLIKRFTVIVTPILILYIPYLFFHGSFLKEDAVSYQDNIQKLFSFLTTEEWKNIRSIHIVEQLLSMLGISAYPSMQITTIITGLFMFIALLRASLYQDKIAQLFLYSLFGTILIYSISGHPDKNQALLHLLLPLFLFLLSLLSRQSNLVQLRLTWVSISLLLFCLPLFYAKRKQKLTMPEYDIFRKVAMEVVEKGLLIRGFDGVESIQHAKPHHIGYMVGYLGGKLDPCSKEIVIAREDGCFFLLEEKGPNFPQ